MGPLAGVRVIEIGSIGPGPFCAMLLADMGAEVVRVDRFGAELDPLRFPGDPTLRGRRSIAVDLKHPEGPGVVLRLVEAADALIEGYRPGVAERLGIGPDECLDRNPRLVYGRMTGWGRSGPLSARAGHDIDYIAVAGALGLIGPAGASPAVPLNLIGDYGGGAVLLAFGIVCALLESRRSGRGQVVDAAMVDGAALLTSLFYGLAAAGAWGEPRGGNLLDGGAPFYTVYPTADGGYMAVGAIEPAFYAALLEGLGLDPDGLPDQYDTAGWPALREALAGAFAVRTRREWTAVFEGTDACVAPVLTMGEAPSHPHNRERETFIEVGGVVQPAPAPRFGRTPPGRPAPPARPGEHTGEVLETWGLPSGEIARLREAGAIQ